MTRRHLLKTNFTAGELDPQLFGRVDLRAYENGASRLMNVVPHPTGGVSRRAGTSYLDTLPGPARLIAFEFNTEQFYVLALTNFRIDVYLDGVLVAANLSAPWHQSDLWQLAWVQSADTLVVTHPDYMPRMVTRDGLGAWSISQIRFVTVGKRFTAPFAKFAADEVTLSANATTGTARITASADLFQAAHQGSLLRLQEGEARITRVVNARAVDVDIRSELASTDPTTDWLEEAFSPVRGWPVTVTFHQNRLVFGGSRDLPNQIWLSKTDDLFNFDPGEGLDDDAIHFGLLSDQVNAVRGLVSAADLQIFTSGGEWRVTGDPLTPKTIQVKRQSRVGSRTDRHVPPRIVDGATLFVSRDGNGLREFAYSDADQGYVADDLALLAKHLVRDVVEFDYLDQERLVYAVLGDGTMALLTQYRAEKVTAWARMETDGVVTSVAVAVGQVYLVVERDGGRFLELLEPGLRLDFALGGSAEPPTATWSGLDHLEGREVALVADGRLAPSRVVQGGKVVLDAPASELTAGLPYRHEVAPLPAQVGNALGIGHGIRVRLIAVTFRLFETAELDVDVGDGPRPIPFARLGTGLLDAPIAPMSGAKRVQALGWRSSGEAPLWRIEGRRPLPFTLLSVTSEIKVND